MNGKYKIVLDAMSDETGAKNDFNLFQTRSVLLAQLDGTSQRYTRVDLRKMRKKPMTQEEIEARETYEERTGMPPPPVFDTLQMTFRIIDQEEWVHEQKLEVDM